MLEYLDEIEFIIDELERLTDSSEVIYDQEFHNEIIARGDVIFQKIKNDNSLGEKTKSLLLTVLTTSFKAAKIEMENFF